VQVSVGGAAGRFSSRRVYIDWARGIAVLLMIGAHTLDAWTRASDRTSAAFAAARILGGFAAPLFLWLAGVAVVLSASETARRKGSRAAAVQAICRRGLEIFVLAFLFRLQAFIVTPGNSALSLFRVDILNIMGLAIVAAGVVWGIARTSWLLVLIYGALAAIVSAVTPIVYRGGTLLSALPVWVQWYLRPAGEYTTFVAFPWVGFVFGGAATGALLAAWPDASGGARIHARLAFLGGLLVSAALHLSREWSLYRDASFWTSSPAFFAIRAGVMMLALPVLYCAWRSIKGLEHPFGPLEQFGRHSLFVYWIHVELVYGYASWPLWRALPLWLTGAACLVFSALMYGAVAVRGKLARSSTFRLRGSWIRGEAY
jgi:uncharacterized membrane protein